MMLQMICLACSWGLIIFLIVTTFNHFKRGINYLKRLHQIPCSRCAFFTNNYLLKCTVHPQDAGTEAAIYCRDFEPQSTVRSPGDCSYRH